MKPTHKHMRILFGLLLCLPLLSLLLMPGKTVQAVRSAIGRATFQSSSTTISGASTAQQGKDSSTVAASAPVVTSKTGTGNSPNIPGPPPPRPTAVAASFTNSTGITITDCPNPCPASGQAASLFPSPITVSGEVGVVQRVSITLNGFSHGFPADVDFLLVSPSGRKSVLMSDFGAGSPGVSSINVTLDDYASRPVPSTVTGNTGVAFTTGAYRPANSGTTDVFPAPAPASPFTYTLSAFNGDNPNGTWNLYIIDDANLDGGSISGGWTITFDVRPPAPAPGDILISEFRTRGAGTTPPGSDGSADEFIEIYNNTNQSITIIDAIPGADPTSPTGAGWRFAGAQGATETTFLVLPQTLSTAGPLALQPRGYFLISTQPTTPSPAGNTYSLSTYPTGTGITASGSANVSVNPASATVGFLPDDVGLAVFATANALTANRLDSVGYSSVTNADYKEGTGLSPASGITTAGQHSWVRKETSGVVQDTGNNASDFVLVDTTGATLNGIAAVLGAPGPERGPTMTAFTTTSAPAHDPFANNMLVEVIDPMQAFGAAPNAISDATPVTNGALGTLKVRAKFTNNSGLGLIALRYRLVNLSTLTGGSVPMGQADLRLLNSSTQTITLTDTSTVTAQALTLQTPPTQTSGGALNSSLAEGVITTTAPLANGASTIVEFNFGIQQYGTVQFVIIAEGLNVGLIGVSGKLEATGSVGPNPGQFILTAPGAPTITCPANVTVSNTANQCSAVVTYPAATATGSPAPTVMCAPPSGSTFSVGTTTVTCTATNGIQPNATCTFTVTVQDTQAPTLAACPANITVPNTSGTCAANVTYTAPTAMDNCPGATVACLPASGSSFAVGTTTVTCTASDASPNSSDTTCTFTVTVQDTQAPTISACPANISVSGSVPTVVTYTPPTANDNCPGATVSCVPPSGSSFAVGTTTVTCTASDTSPNSSDATCSFTVTVTPPCTITCPANQVAWTSGTTATVTYPAPTTTGSCGTVTCSPASGSTFNVGTTTVTCSTTVGPSCSFNVTVNRLTLGASLADPLACSGPGNQVNGSFSATNTTGASASVTVSATLSNLVYLPNTATANQPGAVVVLANVISWTGTLGAGQTVTVSYLAQIADNATPGTQACSVTTATVNALPVQGSASACVTVNCPPVGPGSIFPASAEASDQKMGSVLIYNVYTSGATSGNTQNTRINITNTHLSRPAFVHLFFVAEGCAIADSYICLTGNQTASFLASDLDPGTTGYLVAIAVNEIGCPTSHNYLIGDEYVKFTTGHAANLGAIAFSQLAGGLPLCDGNSNTAAINFDGISYNRTPATLALDNIGSRADGNDTLLIVNRIGGNLGIGASSLGTLFGIFYDDAENALSFSVTGGCQLRNSITNNFPRITPRFETFVPAGRTGWLKIYNQTGAVGITGAAINVNPNAASSAGAFNQGHNLHHLTLNNQMSYIIPVFPPSC